MSSDGRAARARATRWLLLSRRAGPRMTRPPFDQWSITLPPHAQRTSPPHARRRPRNGSAGSRHAGRSNPSRQQQPPKRTAASALDAALDAALALPAPPPRTYAQLGLPQQLVTTLARRGIHEPFAIQSRALPDSLQGREVL